MFPRSQMCPIQFSIFSGGSRLLWTGVQIASFVTTPCFLATKGCLCKAIQNYKTWHHRGRNFLHYVGERLARHRQNFFLKLMGDKMNNICDIVICINIMVMSMHVCSFSAESVLPAAVVAAAINKWLIVYTTTATHTIQLEDLN